MVEPAEEQNKRDMPIMAGGGGWFTKYVTLWGGGLIHVSCVTHRQMGGGGETACAT